MHNTFNLLRVDYGDITFFYDKHVQAENKINNIRYSCAIKHDFNKYNLAFLQ